MQTRFNLKTETLDAFVNNFPGWTLTTWSDTFGRWHYEVRGPKGTWEGFGFWNEREARTRGFQSITLAA